MTTIEQFGRAWQDYTIRCRRHGLRQETMEQILPAFRALAAAFEKQFGVSIHALENLPMHREISGEVLAKLKAWVEGVKKATGWDYGYCCGLQPHPSSPPVVRGTIYIIIRGIIFNKKRKALRFKPRKK